LLLVWLLVLPASADEPPKEENEAQAAQSEAPKQAATPTSTGSSLADAAAGIKLRQPAGGEGSGLVISDQNLKESGSGAALSQGAGAKISGGAASAGTQAQPAGGTSPEASARANEIVQRYHAQLALVEGLEVRLANWNKLIAEGSPDAHYKKFSDSPQNRPPGVVDEAEGQRDLLAKRLAEEQQKLDAIRKEAKGAGVALSEAAAPPPAAAPADGGS
jgi:hypothetical protein